MSVINTNITSMIGQSNLNKSQNALQTSMERLSSGLRINSAKDDAAGQAIANRMTAQINGLAQAQRNANDGISIAQTAEGSLNQINDNLQRIRELTVQAANGTNSQDDLQSIQDEVNQRLDEIDRISRETDFNGTNVLKEGVEAITIQVGARDNETISVNLTAINRDTLKLDGFQVLDGINVEALGSAVENSGTIAGPAIAVTYADDAADSNTTSGATLITADQIDNLVSYQTYGSGASPELDGNTAYAIQVGSAYYAATVNSAGVVTGWDSTSALTVGTTDGNIAIQNANVTEVPGADVTVSGLEEGQVLRAGENAGEYVVQEGTGEDAKYFSATVGEDGAVTVGRELAVGDKSVNPLEQLDEALNIVDSLRSELGAVQNRFEDAITNLRTNETNLAAARSRIEDADYAVEVANMTRAQILQQAGTSVLAQANQIPQNVLSLLG